MQNWMYLDLCLVVLLVAASIQDLATRKISNRLIGAGLLCATTLHLVSGAPLAAVTTGLAGAVTGLLLFLPLYRLGGTAAGDVKLMAMVGAFTGPRLAFEISLATFCIGGLMALAIVLTRGQLRTTCANAMALLRPLYLRALGVPMVRDPAAASVGGMPYGLAIALASWLLLWYRHG